MALNRIMIFLCVLTNLYSCSEETKCKKHIDNKYYSSNMTRLASDSIFITNNKVGFITSYNHIAETFGKEIRISDVRTNEETFHQYTFSYGESEVYYHLYDSLFRLSAVYFNQKEPIVIMGEDTISGLTEISFMKEKYLFAFCNSTYNEQFNHYDMQFEGTIDDEIIHFRFKNNKLQFMEIYW